MVSTLAFNWRDRWIESFWTWCFGLQFIGKLWKNSIELNKMLWSYANFYKCRSLQCFLFQSSGKLKFDLNLWWICSTIYHISHIHHIMEYLAELFFVHSDLSLRPLLRNIDPIYIMIIIHFKWVWRSNIDALVTFMLSPHDMLWFTK